MASGRLGKCDLQSCCGTQVYQNQDPNECPVSLTYHAQALSTSVNVKLTTFVGIASTTLFAETDTFTWPHAVPMNCSFGGWISCHPMLLECREIINADALCNYWAKCGVVKSNTGAAVTQTSCYITAHCGYLNAMPPQGTAGLNIGAGFGTAVGDPGAIGARFPMPVEYTSGVGTTTRGQAYWSGLCQCIGMRCISGSNPFVDTWTEATSGYPFGRTCDGSNEGFMCRCCVPAPYGGSEIVNPGIALTQTLYRFKGCNTPHGNMSQTKILGYAPGVYNIHGQWCGHNCCAISGSGIRIITEAHVCRGGNNIEAALQQWINPCCCCGGMAYSNISGSTGCKCPGGSCYYLQFCESTNRNYNCNWQCGEAWDFMDWYALTNPLTWCNCCRCKCCAGFICHDIGQVCFDWNSIQGSCYKQATEECGYACGQEQALGTCYRPGTAPFMKIAGFGWAYGAPSICICCNNCCCGLIKMRACMYNYMCCSCAACRFYNSPNWSEKRSMICVLTNYQTHCYACNGCSICWWSLCNDNNAPWSGTLCESVNSCKFTHGGGLNFDPNNPQNAYVMNPYGVKAAASNGIAMYAIPCGGCTAYWMHWMGNMDNNYRHTCTNCNCSLRFYHFYGNCPEQANGVYGDAFVHDSEAAHGQLSQCTDTFCVGYMEYPMKYFAYNPVVDCHYFMMRSYSGCNCGIFSADWRIFQCIQFKKCRCNCSSQGIICLCRNHIKSMKDHFYAGFIGILSTTGCVTECAINLQYAGLDKCYVSRGGLTCDNQISGNGTPGSGLTCGSIGITSVIFHKQAPFPAAMTARKYTTPRMCVSCLFRADYSLWSLSLYNCSTCSWDAFLSPDLINWSGQNFSSGNLEASCKVTCFSSDQGKMFTVCDCFMANVDCSGVLDYCYEFNNYERTGVVLSFGDRLYVKNHSTTPFSFQVWGYEG